MKGRTVATGLTVGAGLFLAGVGVGQVRPLKFAAYLKPTNTTEMRLAVLETNVAVLRAYTPTENVDIPALVYWPSCQCFRATVSVRNIKNLSLDKLRTELAQRSFFSVNILRASIPELKNSDVHIEFTQFDENGTKVIGNYENGELTLK